MASHSKVYSFNLTLKSLLSLNSFNSFAVRLLYGYEEKLLRCCGREPTFVRERGSLVLLDTSKVLCNRKNNWELIWFAFVKSMFWLHLAEVVTWFHTWEVTEMLFSDLEVLDQCKEAVLLGAFPIYKSVFGIVLLV